MSQATEMAAAQIWLDTQEKGGSYKEALNVLIISRQTGHIYSDFIFCITHFSILWSWVRHEPLPIGESGVCKVLGRGITHPAKKRRAVKVGETLAAR